MSDEPTKEQIEAAKADGRKRAHDASEAFLEVVKCPRDSRLRMRQAIRMMLDHMTDGGDIRLCCHLLNMFDAINGEPPR
jgi:hypothetical protein